MRPRQMRPWRSRPRASLWRVLLWRASLWRAVSALAALAAVLLPTRAAAQVEWRDLVFTLGGSVERYAGNFAAITVPVVDSTDRVVAGVGEVAVRGDVRLFARGGQSLRLLFDGGMRQSAASGFVFRDYAPREWVGSSTLDFTQGTGATSYIYATARLRSRAVEDRPPMPLFLQPGYTSEWAALGFVTGPLDGVTFDVQGDIEGADYRALRFVPQLDLLDRRGVGAEAGARWGSERGSIRFFGGYRRTHYRQQGTFDDEDPFRRDGTVRSGLEWTRMGRTTVQVGVDGAVNRSNSNRPEYDALSVSGFVQAPLPADFTLVVSALVTGKRYVHETDFARLVPGEEADNASIAYLELTRPMAVNLNGALRFGWTRAETDIANSYYQRFGLSLRLNYRPLGR